MSLQATTTTTTTIIIIIIIIIIMPGISTPTDSDDLTSKTSESETGAKDNNSEDNKRVWKTREKSVIY
jgi:hypothetical protein